MMAAAALADRGRWILGSGLLATLAVVTAGIQAGDAAANAAFPYPPHARLLMLPFGAMQYGVAAAIWSALNLFCVYRAAELISPRRDLALFAALSPAALMTFASGYAGGFLALLAAVVVMQGHERPARAGVCLALMTVEPQLALLFAAMLFLLGYRRATLIAIPWTLALLAASVITFGVWPWSEFLHPDATRTATALSLQSGARIIGLSGWAAQILQWSFGFVALAGAAIAFVRLGPKPRSIALLLLAIVLALPGANSDLLVVAAPALTLALFAENPSGERPFLSFVPALLIWLMPILAVSSGAIAWPVAPVVAAGSMLAALARESAWKRGQDAVVSPIEARREGAP